MQTTAHRIDTIVEYLKTKKYFDLVCSVAGNWDMVFPFDPTKNKAIGKIFVETDDQFPVLVKAAIVSIVREMGWNYKTPIENALQNLTIQLWDAETIKMHQWNSKYEGKPVAVRCIVLGMDKQETYTKSIVARCGECNNEEIVFPDTLTGHLPLSIPCTTPECVERKLKLAYDNHTIKSGDVQDILIQEPIEEAVHGNPRIFDCQIKDHDVMHTFLGQHKKVIGIFRSAIKPTRHKPTNKVVIQALSMIDLEDVDPVMPTEEEHIKIKELVKDENFIGTLTKSFAPEIYGEKLAKLCVIIALTGGTRVGRLRGLINAILIGDPSTGKTKLLEYIPVIAQKSAYANGRMATGAGLTIGIDKLADGRKFPRAGPIPLCSGGFVGLDELGQLQPSDLSALHECMESGKITFAKAGYNFTLSADTTIIGAANPKGDRYDTDYSIVDNINLHETILSRFDLKVLMRDIPNAIEDEKQIEHIAKMRTGQLLEGVLEMRFLMAYLNYCRKIKPKFDHTGIKLIKDFYHTLRTLKNPKGSIPIDKRTYESLYRASTAFAKLYLSETVNTYHVKMAISLYKECLQSFGQETENVMHQLPLTSLITNREQAFIFTWRTLEKQSENNFISESEFVNKLHLVYPDYYPSIQAAQDAFNKKFETTKEIVQTAGKYKLI